MMLIILRAESYNSPAYESYLKDCTNFVLQCFTTSFIGGVATTLQSDYPISVGSQIEIR